MYSSIMRKEFLVVFLVLCLGCMPRLTVSTGGTRLVGAPVADENPNSPKYRGLTEHALKHLAASEGRDYFDGLFEIVNVTKQVVAGMKYRIVANIGKSKCKQSDEKKFNLTNCPPTGTTPAETCLFVIWEKPWENMTKVLEATCQPFAAATSS